MRFRLGAITAIVGPNGSGKTTLLETLLGFRRGGTDVRVLDVPAARFMRDTPSLRRIGAQLQKVEYPDHLRVSEIVALHRAMYVRVDAAVTDALGIAELLDKPCRALSKGSASASISMSRSRTGRNSPCSTSRSPASTVVTRAS